MPKFTIIKLFSFENVPHITENRYQNLLLTQNSKLNILLTHYPLAKVAQHLFDFDGVHLFGANHRAGKFFQVNAGICNRV